MKATKLVTAFGLTAIAAAVSTSSYAFDLVKSDELTFNLNGDLDLEISHDSSNNNRTEIIADFDDIDFDIKWKIDDDLTFTAGADLKVADTKSSDAENQATWIGFNYQDIYTRIGYVEDAVDPMGIDSFDIHNMGKASGDQDGGGTKFEETILAGYKGDGYDIIGSYNFASSSAESDTEIPSRLAVYGKTKVGDFLLEGSIGQEENFEKDIKASFWQASVEYFTGPATLSALYSSMKIDQTDDGSYTNGDFSNTSTGIEFNAKYKVNSKLSVFAGYETIDNGISGTENYTGKAIGMQYAFSKLVKLNIEAGTSEGNFIKADTTNSNGVTTNDVGDGSETSKVGMLLSVDF